MKRKLRIGFVAMTAAVAMVMTVASMVFAQKQESESVAPSAVLFTENFTQSAGTVLTTSGWAAHSGAGTNPLTVSAPGLMLAGYPGSGVGNAVALTTSGEDVNRAFAAQTSGTVYASFLVTVTEASQDPAGGYFFHLGPDPIGTTFRGRVFAKKDASNNVAFGISKAATAVADIAYTPFSYTLGTTYMIVVKYTIVDGATNDTVSMIVSPTVPSSEPAATVTATDIATQSDINPGTVAIRQGATATSPTVRVDGIRVGTTWADIVSGPASIAQNIVDFDGDGRTDFTVVRNTGGGSNGQVTWFTRLNGSSALTGSAWGLATDFFVPADFDGDQKTDIAVWRPAPATQAAFYILKSSDNTVQIEFFGQTGDTPTVVGDYDGDGKADVAVYRAGATAGAQSTWFYRGSLNNPSGATTFVPWGVNGDFVAPGDYDGDGRNDFVVQRNGGNGQAQFWMNQTQAGFATVSFGLPSDRIVPGDYDGDGKTDLAVVRTQGGTYNWYLRPSSTGVASATPFAIFGSAATDLVVPGDYDGDGRNDAAVWRPSATAGASAFWILNSVNGAVNFQPFGSQGDFAVANAFSY